jgi:tricorn protease
MPPGYYRFPTIHADTVVFVCEDDLWTVPASGGVARRLTSNLGEVTRPVLSPDGSQLAFVGREEGQSEIYLMPAQGGQARRLTYMGGGLCITCGWTQDGKIIFANNADHWYLRFTYLYTIETNGNLPEKLNYGLARGIAYGPAGGILLGRHTDEPARWKRYRGGTAGQLWIDENEDGNFHRLTQPDGNLTSPMWLQDKEWPKGRIYFISDHEGIGNLYSCLPSGQDLRRHTDHEDFYVRNASTDGQRIVYHAGADLFIYEPDGDLNYTIPIEFHSPQTQRQRKFVEAWRYLESTAIHPGGQAVGITARGKVFNFANWEGAVFQHGMNSGTLNGSPAINEPVKTGVRYRLPRWLKDGKRIIAVSDAGGEEAFVILQSDGQGEEEHLPDLDIGRPEAIAVNPQKDQIAFSNHRYELVFLDLTTRELKVIDRGKASPISGFDWSPDGEWLVYSVSQSLQVSILKLWQAATGETYPITQPLLRDVAPAFDPLGKYILFLSYRQFDPVNDNLQFDFNFPRGMRPFLITLQKETLSPFIPMPKTVETEEEESKEDEHQPETGDETAEPTGEVEKGEKRSEEILVIDLEGIQYRVVAFPVPEGRYGRVLGTKDGKMLYSRYPVLGTLNHDFIEDDSPAQGTLFIYNFEEQKEEQLFTGISTFDLTPDGGTLIYRTGNRLRVLKAGDKPDERNGSSPSRKTGWLDLGRVKIPISPGSEWRQMFREAWRLQRDQFWTEDMSQVDWLAVHDRYLPLVDRISSRSEFSDLMWEMQGELGTSHAYEFGGDYRPEPNYAQGFLGARYEYDAETDSWRIIDILHGDSWDPGADSPLNGPGINVQIGDRITAINGIKLNRYLSPTACLVNLADEEVSLTVAKYNSPKDNSEETEQSIRIVTVHTLSSEMQGSYRQWVENNRKQVHAATDGKVGYLHIPDMGAWGYAEFHRGYLAEVYRQGLIVDLRFNRGGMVSALLLEKLARRRLGYDSARWIQVAVPYPPESVGGPIVALTNEYAGSDGDIFSHGFKLMKLGPLIGKRTWGGVIGIEPRHNLVDGTVTTQPEYSFWFSDVGWGIENYGTDPDIEVDITPQDYARNYDAQLERGIEEIQKLLEENPPEIPDFKDKPSRALPRLPRR